MKRIARKSLGNNRVPHQSMPSDRARKRFAAAALILAAGSALTASSPAQAQRYTWSGNGQNANWDYQTPLVGLYTNWAPLTLPPQSADIVFGSGFASGNPNCGGNQWINSLNFDTTSTFSVISNQFFFDEIINGTGNVTRSAGSSGTQNVNVITELFSNGTWTIDGTGSLVFGNTIKGSVALNKQGSGTLVFGSGASDTQENQLLGTNSVSAGTLLLNKADGTNAVAVSLAVSGGAVSFLRSNQLANGCAVAVNSGHLDLNGFSDTVGPLSGSGGTINLGSGALTVNQLNAGTFAGVITGTGSFTKAFDSTLTLGGGASDTSANTYSGTTTVNAGTLLLNKAADVNAINGTLTINSSGAVALNRANQINPNAAVTVNIGATLALHGFGQTLSNLSGTGKVDMTGPLIISTTGTDTFAGTLLGTTGSLGKSGTGTLVLGGGAFDTAANTYTGPTFVVGGMLILDKASGTNAVGGDLILSSATAKLNRSNQIADAGRLTVGTGTFLMNGFSETVAGLDGSPGTLDLSSGTLTVNMDASMTFGGVAIGASGNLVKGGTGSLALGFGNDNAPNTYGGSTIVNAGTLLLNKASGTNAVAGALTVNGGQAMLARSNQIADGVTVAVNAGTFHLNGSSETIGALSSNAGGIVNVGGGNLTVNQTAGTTVSSTIVGSSGSFTKSGNGTLTLGSGVADAAANTFTGTTTVNGGQLVLNKATGFSAIAGSITIGGGEVLLNRSHIIADASVLTVNSGTFNMGGATNEAIGGISGSGGVVNLSSGTLQVLQANAGTYAGTIRGSAGTFKKAGVATVTLGGGSSDTAPNTAGNTIINGGILILDKAPGTNAVGGNLAIGTGFVGNSAAVTLARSNQIADTAVVTFDSGALNMGGATIETVGGISGTSGAINLGSGTLIVNQAAEGTYAGSFSGSAGTMVKAGSATLTLAGSSSDATGKTIVNAGTLVVAHPQALGRGALAINSASTVLSPGLAGAPRVAGLNMAGTGKLDMNDNDLVVGSDTSKSQIETYVRTARNGGAWDGPGITSTFARNHVTHSTTLGVLSGAEFHSVFGANAVFGGATVGTFDSLVKYTWYGDTDFNGAVDFDDYARIDAGYNNAGSGWLNGDLDFNGVVNFDDYSLVDVAFNNQSGSLRRALSYLDGGDRSNQGMNTPALQLVMNHFGQFGQSYATGFLNAVPEPASALALSGLAALTASRRRRRRSDAR